MALFRQSEVEPPIPEPRPLGVEIDPESAALWEEFMTTSPSPALDQVYELWKDPRVTNPTIRQRAVTVLTGPYGYNLPYSEPDQGIGRLLSIEEKAEGQTIRPLRDRLANRPDLATELASGVLFWTTRAGGRMARGVLDSEHSYRQAAQELLPLVDEPTADQLFGLLTINDSEPYYSMDEASGYQPAQNLLRDMGVPSKYKDATLTAWLAVAQRERAGEAAPRKKWEDATKKLAEFVTIWTYGSEVDEAIHTRIIDFLENNFPQGQHYIGGHAVGQVAEHITDDDLRFRFGLRHIFEASSEDRGAFRITNDRERNLVEWLQTQAMRTRGPEYASRVQGLFEDYESGLARARAAQIAAAQLLEKLRA